MLHVIRLVGVLALIGTLNSFAEEYRYTPTKIDDGYGYSTALNGNGQAAVTLFTLNNYTCRNFFWSSGTATDIYLDPTNTNTVTGVSSGGNVVGNTGTRGFQAYNGQAVIIPTLPGGSSNSVSAINASGTAVGSSTLYGGLTHAWVGDWNGVTDITPDFQSSSAIAINGNGEVLGRGYDDEGQDCIFIWSATNGIRVLSGFTGSLSQVYPIAINSNLQVLCNVFGTNVVPVLWDNDTVTELETLGGYYSWATDLNNNGEVVGSSGTVSGYYRPCLWKADGTLVDLIPKLNGNSQITNVECINDDGQMTAYGPAAVYILDPVLQGEDTDPPVFGPIESNDQYNGFIISSWPMFYTYVFDENSGLDESSLLIYIDGVETPGSLSSGYIYTTPLSELTEGTHTIEIHIFDMAGNEAIATWEFIVDLAPPQISNASPYYTYTTPSGIVSADITDTGAGVDWLTTILYVDWQVVTPQINGETGHISYQPATPFSNGTHDVLIIATDYSGGYNNAYWNFTIDDTPPEISGFSPAENGWANSQQYYVSVAFSDAASGVNINASSITIDGNPPSAYGATVSSTGMLIQRDLLADGGHEVVITLADCAGNISQETHWIFNVDANPPSLSGIAPADSSTTPFMMPCITGIFEDGAGAGVNWSTVTVNLNEMSLTVVQDVSTFICYPPANLANGTYTVAVHCQDNAQNYFEQFWSFTVDAHPLALLNPAPEPDSLFGGTGFAIGGQVQMGQSYNVYYEVYLDDQFQGSGYGLEISVPVTANSGLHTAEIFLSDDVGGNASVEWSFTNDGSAPFFDEIGPAAGQTVHFLTTPIYVACSDVLAGLDVSSVVATLTEVGTSNVHSLTFTVESGHFYTESPELSAGDYLVNFSISDTVGNTASTDWTFTVSFAPYVQIVSAVNRVPTTLYATVWSGGVEVTADCEFEWCGPTFMNTGGEVGEDAVAGDYSCELNVTHANFTLLEIPFNLHIAPDVVDGTPYAEPSENTAGQYTITVIMQEVPIKVTIGDMTTFTVRVKDGEGVPVTGKYFMVTRNSTKLVVARRSNMTDGAGEAVIDVTGLGKDDGASISFIIHNGQNLQERKIKINLLYPKLSIIPGTLHTDSTEVGHFLVKNHLGNTLDNWDFNVIDWDHVEYAEEPVPSHDPFQTITMVTSSYASTGAFIKVDMTRQINGHQAKCEKQMVYEKIVAGSENP